MVQFAVEEALVVKLGAHERRENLKRETDGNVRSAQQKVRDVLAALRKRDAGRV